MSIVPARLNLRDMEQEPLPFDTRVPPSTPRIRPEWGRLPPMATPRAAAPIASAKLPKLGALTDRPTTSLTNLHMPVYNMRARPLPLTARGIPLPPRLPPKRKEKFELTTFRYPTGIDSVAHTAMAEPYELMKHYHAGTRPGTQQVGTTVFPLRHVDAWSANLSRNHTVWNGSDSWKRPPLPLH